MTNQTISGAEFLALREEKPNTVVVDVRTAAELSNEFLAGCLHLPLHEVSDQALQALLAEKGRETGEIVYLLCGTGMRASKAAEQLSDKLGNPLVIVEGGISKLKQSGCMLEKGSGSVISLERQVRIVAGSFVLLGTVLGAVINPSFYALSAFVGAGLIFAGITDTCGMAILLSRMPWNR